ncbi:SNF2-related protein [Microlunatus ginsengisoli]
MGSPIAPGSVVVVRDEEWLVTSLDQTTDGQLVQVQGLSELVSGTTASFYESLDDIEVQDPATATLVADDSPSYRRARLWLDATIRKTPVPLSDPRLTVSTGALADQLAYQQAAARQALDPDNLRPRILLADAVGLGKTLEIGMILSELARRGRADRVLIVCPKHVLEQMQHELWTRFALPFVRLDSLGVQRVRQELPATRNPFTYFKRVIISIDTLKRDRFVQDLRRHRWDAVVIDESHNVTNSATQNNKLARVLAPNTDALILASATPHNGRADSFAELIRLLEPTAVAADGELNTAEVARLVVRRHRHSDEVASVVGDDWAQRRDPQHFLVDASPAENDVADELDQVWLHPPSGRSAYSGAASTLFPWTLAKAFLSSPAALSQTITERRHRLKSGSEGERERAALDRLAELNERCLDDRGAKYARLVDYLRGIGVAADSPTRAVIFAERVKTLEWLRNGLAADLGLTSDAVVTLHGGLSDERQQEVVESFKLSASPIRLLVTGDIASEGVNLHLQCHELIHFDIPWSLIRIEQRNGRIDRYGQRTRPQITTLLLRPDNKRFAGDLRVLSRLLEREQVAHAALGDVASLMGKYSVQLEEDELARVLAGQRDFDDAVVEPSAVTEVDPIAAFLAGLTPSPTATSPTDTDAPITAASGIDTLYPTDVDFLRDALVEIYMTPEADERGGGVGWREHLDHGVVGLDPPPDLRQRLRVLPASYLRKRRVDTRLTLAVTELRGRQSLDDARAEAPDGQGGTSWPEAHYLAPLHPVLDWAADRALNTLDRHQVFVVRGEVEHPTVLLWGTLTNRRGQIVASSVLAVEFPNPANLAFTPTTVYASVAEAAIALGFDGSAHNPGPVAGIDRLQPLLTAAVRAGEVEVETLTATAAADATRRIDAWQHRASSWSDAAQHLQQTPAIKQRRVGVNAERALAEGLAPDRALVRPLIMVLPPDHPVQAVS